MNYNIKVSCSKERLKSIREFVKNTLSDYAIDEVEISQLVLAVDEVCANMIIHSHGCDDTQTIEIKIDVEPNQGIVFQIIDKGISFNFSTYQEPSLEKIIETKKKGGIGLMLVKRIMDDVQFSSNNGLNVCRMFKKLQKN